jgi:hypothetical protein
VRRGLDGSATGEAIPDVRRGLRIPHPQSNGISGAYETLTESTSDIPGADDGDVWSHAGSIR